MPGRLAVARLSADVDEGIFALLDVCSDHERDLMHGGLDEAGRLLLRDLVDQHTQFHKYTGRV